MAFCLLISQMLCSLRRLLLAAELSFYYGCYFSTFKGKTNRSSANPNTIVIVPFKGPSRIAIAVSSPRKPVRAPCVLYQTPACTVFPVELGHLAPRTSDQPIRLENLPGPAEQTCHDLLVQARAQFPHLDPDTKSLHKSLAYCLLCAFQRDCQVRGLPWTARTGGPCCQLPLIGALGARAVFVCVSPSAESRPTY